MMTEKIQVVYSRAILRVSGWTRTLYGIYLLCGTSSTSFGANSKKCEPTVTLVPYTPKQ
jgi:hypothetical protein